MRFILKTLGFLFLLLVLVIIILLFIPDQHYQSLAEKAIQKATNRQAMIGDFVTERNLTPTIKLKQFTLANPDWTKKPEMVTADEFSASFDLIELIKGKLDIDLSSESLTVDLIRNKQGKANWAFADTDASARNQHSKNPSIQTLARFVLKHLKMKDFRLIFDDQQAGKKHELIIDKMDAIEIKDGIAQKFDAKGALDDLPLSLSGITGTFLELKNNKKLPLNLKATVDDLTLSLKGSIDAQADELNLNTVLDLSLPTLAVISKFTSQKLPDDWKNIKGSGKLHSTAGQYSLKDIELKMDSGFNVDVKGAITDLKQMQGVDIDLTASLSTIQSLSSFTSQPLPDLGPVKFSGKMVSDQNKLTLRISDLNYNGEYGKVDISGDIGNLPDLEQVNLKTDIDLPNLNIAKLFTDQKIPALGNIKLTGNVVSNGSMDISANDLKLIYDHQGLKLDANGSVKSIVKNGGELDIDAKASVNSLASLNELAKSELPNLGPIHLSSKITGTFAEIKINQIIAELRDTVLTGNIKGDIGSINKLDQIKIEADLNSTSIGDLFLKFGIQSTAKTPAQLTVSLNKVAEGVIIDRFAWQMENNKITGKINLEKIWAKSQRPKLSGNIEVTKFSLSDVLGAPSQASVESTEKPQGIAIPDTPLPLSLIRDNDLDLTLAINEFDSRFISLKDTNIKVVADQGKLLVGPFNSKLNGGDTSFETTIDASSTPANLSIKTTINGFSFKQAGTFKDSRLLENDGSANASLDITGSGESIAAVLSTANGNASVDIKNLIIKNDLIKFVSGDLVKEATAKLNPLEKDKDTTKINCGAIKVNITDGVMKAQNAYILDADVFTITGKAQVNLKNQKLNIEVNTNPKEGLGLGLGELAKAIKIEGTIENPKVGLNAEGVAKLGATAGAAVATGGVSLLAQGQLEKVKANSESCAEVLK